ncbi:hypothetical protein W911_12540 [Hyphomicrobium nitrativorans NL23]|uniref:Uncharacterized protein n=1 Tax=Hyphomicrobium nitrativorans NL23 TaxID=1029756 RepID=V5SH96_9HYPH|nr:hypothetical protein [Hyphomicrobium nitrativorans]AHB50261.1 hypothetical protein W911_12540 [Hyphomicrobium nitrativorans NL23]
MQLDDETWADVRRAYEDGTAPLKEIAARFDVTPQRIGVRAKKEGWDGRERSRRPARLKEKKPQPVTGAAQAAEESGRGKTPALRRTVLPTRGAQRALIGRLYRAISLKLEHMEMRMASGEARSAQDEERESRALATLISNFEKVTEAVADLDRDKDAARGTGRVGADAERMRREIAERLERLGGVGPAGRPSGKSRS